MSRTVERGSLSLAESKSNRRELETLLCGYHVLRIYDVKLQTITNNEAIG